MAQVDPAEKEASEVLHSLLSVERIEKTEPKLMIESDDPTQSHNFQTSLQNNDETETDAHIQWHTTPVSLGTHSLFATIDPNAQFQQTMDDQQVIWEGHTIQVDNEQQQITAIYTAGPNNNILESATPPESPKAMKPKTPIKGNKKKTINKKKNKGNLAGAGNIEQDKMNESAVQVKERFKRGCECQDESCFRGLNADSVYRHRLHIAELTKAEHDMYLMGVTMACLANPDQTVRHKERRRLRAQYVYQGRRVCLDAFLYLENCTHYQLKRIRKHVMTHGVAPRIHGNHGKKPHNTFSLDIYRNATEFLKHYIQTHVTDGSVNSKQSIQLPWDITRKHLHDSYKEYGQILEPGIKLMGYSTFRHFMKEQFPHLKFSKVEPKHNSQVQQPQQQDGTQQLHNHIIQKSHIQNLDRPREQPQDPVIGKAAEVQQVIPLVVAPNDVSSGQHHHQTFLVTPVPHQIIQNGNIVDAQNPNGHPSANTFSYQLTNTGYVINEQGNLITSMPSAQHQTPYTFNRM